MNWKTLFSPGSNLDPEEARKYMEEHGKDCCQLLDVRTENEYKQQHIPGAILIPVKELMGRFEELNADEAVLVYCRSGVRSKAAAQILLGEGFKEVYNMSGGIVAWQGHQAAGPESQGMEFFIDHDFADVFSMSYAMEESLRQLYLGLVDLVDSEAEKKLLQRLANFEESHKSKLAARFPAADTETAEKTDVLESGISRQHIMDYFAPHLGSMRDILELGMMLEAQAYDLYSRLARSAEDDQSRELFEYLAVEETQHLAFLSNEMKNISQA
ncbi:MAG: rhodanese-like domain-containing protein [Thermodesulfobacteriota bacterium]